MKIIVIGAGDHARVIIDTLLAAGRTIIGLTDVSPDLIGTTVLGIPVIGTDAVLAEHSPEMTQLVFGIGSTNLPNARRARFEEFKANGYEFTGVIHPSAIIGREVNLGEGVQIMAGAVIQPSASIGDNVIINTRAGIDHNCEIGMHTHIAPGVNLSGCIKIGTDCFIGCGATVMHGVKVGSNVLVGAGSTVCHDIPDGARVAGSPARDIM